MTITVTDPDVALTGCVPGWIRCGPGRMDPDQLQRTILTFTPRVCVSPGLLIGLFVHRSARRRQLVTPSTNVQRGEVVMTTTVTDPTQPWDGWCSPGRPVVGHGPAE